MVQFPKMADGVAKIASPEEILREDDFFPLTSDEEFELVTDQGHEFVVANSGELGYTNPNLHRRIDNEYEVPKGSNYTMVRYDEKGNAYPQTFVIGVWDRVNSYRTITTYIHDEESTTCEIP